LRSGRWYVPGGGEQGRQRGRRGDPGDGIEGEDAAPGPHELALAVDGPAAPVRGEYPRRPDGERDLAAGGGGEGELPLHPALPLAPPDDPVPVRAPHGTCMGGGTKRVSQIDARRGRRGEKVEESNRCGPC
jgi:hypothetical protein